MAGANPKVYQYKLVLLGESAVGKSSLVLRFVKNSFSEHQESTIGGTPRPARHATHRIAPSCLHDTDAAVRGRDAQV